MMKGEKIINYLTAAGMDRSSISQESLSHDLIFFKNLLRVQKSVK